jgi:putative ubiquitin-RnfH superfamily antitoxin RatB of RatAB toxin-antitoxin module
MVPVDDDISVEVVYALPEQQLRVTLQVPRGTTVGEAIKMSELPMTYPEIDMARCKLGIFGKLVAADTVLNSGDRVEIYRPLAADPKEARRLRAKKPK